MRDAITDVQGIQVGHAQDLDAVTGCTVVLADEGATVGVAVQGAAPGTRETDLCRPGMLVRQANAVLLAGGSAFGLVAADGVMRFLWERGVGFDTGVARVPIVPGAVIFDLGVGKVAWPDSAMGYAACEAASLDVGRGCVGAGTGATVGKLLGPAEAVKSGCGTASVRVGDVTVGALVVVNAFGDVVDPATGEIVAGARDPETGRYVDTRVQLLGAADPGGLVGNTTIGVVATDASLGKEQVNQLARVAHDGLARTIRPVHTLFDGDMLFALATGSAAPVPSGSLLSIAVAAVEAVERAVLDAVRSATSVGGVTAASDAGR